MQHLIINQGLHEKSIVNLLPENRERNAHHHHSLIADMIKSSMNSIPKRANFLQSKVFIAFSTLFLLTINIAIAQTYDFRKVSWGMSRTLVQASELPRQGTFAENRLIYQDTVDETPFSLIYTFNEKSELISARYVLDKVFIDHDFYIQEYLKFKALLKLKYNTPEKDMQNWSAEAKNKDSANWANELEKGNLELNAIWKTQKTIINLLVTKYDQVHLIIDYKAITTKRIDISKYSTRDL